MLENSNKMNEINCYENIDCFKPVKVNSSVLFDRLDEYINVLGSFLSCVCFSNTVLCECLQCCCIMISSLFLAAFLLAIIRKANMCIDIIRTPMDILDL